MVSEIGICDGNIYGYTKEKHTSRDHGSLVV